MVKPVALHALESGVVDGETGLIQNQAEAVVRDALRSGEVAGATELIQNQEDLADFTAFLLDRPSPRVADGAVAEEGCWVSHWGRNSGGYECTCR